MVPDPEDVGKSFDAHGMFNKDFKDLTARERKTLRDAKARRCVTHACHTRNTHHDTCVTHITTHA
eukprot:2794545-Pyramimonas_sp.AAC.2